MRTEGQKKYSREYYREYRKKENWKKYKQTYNYASYTEAKTKVLRHYGQICALCGEHHFSKLSIDHINNDGGDHRRKLNMKFGGYNFYLWIIKNDFPSGFQTLCISCNSRKNAKWMWQNGLFSTQSQRQ